MPLGSDLAEAIYVHMAPSALLIATLFLPCDGDVNGLCRREQLFEAEAQLFCICEELGAYSHSGPDDTACGCPSATGNTGVAEGVRPTKRLPGRSLRKRKGLAAPASANSSSMITGLDLKHALRRRAASDWQRFPQGNGWGSP